MYFRYYLPLEQAIVCIGGNLKILQPKLLSAKLIWNQFNGCRNDINFVNAFWFVIISPGKKGEGPFFKQTWIPFTYECLFCQIAAVVLGKNTLINFGNFVTVFPWIRTRSFISIPIAQGCFVQSLLELGSCASWEEHFVKFGNIFSLLSPLG